MDEIRINEYDKEDIFKLENQIDKLRQSIRKKKFGLVWMNIPEAFENDVENKLSILKEIPEKNIQPEKDNITHILIEGDNYHALTCLNYTHRNSIDVIYIDPPYNTGSDGFKYKDKRILDRFPDGVEVPKDHPFRHSYWLSFMKKRLDLAKELLSDTGVIVVHIDENEVFNLVHIMNEIFGASNDLGTIIWNKKNPKGDPKGVSIMHEYILCYAKNKEEFTKLENILTRPKPNAVTILNKVNSLYAKNGKVLIPEEIREVIKPFDYDKEKLKDFEVRYDLDIINKEFQNWLKRQNFSNGEKAYKFIDEKGDVYRGVSMAWPNKDKAPDHYFIPLIHPVTGKACPVPHRGWRNSPPTMKRLLDENLILFGEDEKKQPERKYLLKENMFEKTPSVYEFAGSSDKFFIDMDLDFPYAKSVDVAKYFINSVHPDPKIVVDFFAGSGTTGHSVIDINKELNKDIQFILVSNNENGIMENVCYPRIKKVIEDANLEKDNNLGLPIALKYYKTDFVGNNNILNITDEDRIEMAHNAGELLAIAEGTMKLEFKTDYYQFYSKDNKVTAIYFSEELFEMESFIENIKKFNKETTIYMFSWSNEINYTDFNDIDYVNVKTIPQPIIEIYKEIYNLGVI